MDESYPLDLSREDVLNELDNLKKLYSLARADIEEKNQQLHDYKRELAQAKALENDYIQEIEATHAAQKVHLKKWQLKIVQLEEDLTSLKQSHSQQIESLQHLIASKDAQIQDFKILKSTNETKEIETCDDLSVENVSLRSVVSSLSDEIVELTESNKCLKKITLDLEETVNNLQSEIASVNESYKCKKDELCEANNLIETMQEDLILTKNELDALKTKPLEKGSQGNSLFAEVNDRRIQLQQDVSDMKAQYVEMKREIGRLSSRIAALLCENAKLCQRWDDETEEKELEDVRQVESYQIRISQLESLVTSYENQISERQKVTPENILKIGEIAFVEQMVENRNKEIERLLKQRSRDSLSQMLLSGQLKGAKAEIRKWRANATQLQCRVGQLQNEIDQYNLNADVKFETPENVVHKFKSVMKTNVNDDKRPTDVISNLNLLQIKEEETQIDSTKNVYVDCSRMQKKLASSVGFIDKENFSVGSCEVSEKFEKTKTVQFSENTVEPKLTDRNRMRRGGRILENKPIFVPSIKKREF